MHEKVPLLSPELQETPLPLRKVMLIGLILFGNTFSLVVLFPFLPFMTHDFFPALHQREIGYKAGYLGSAFSFGSFCAAYFWGKVADRIGRKPVLLMGLFGTIVSIVAFGMAPSFYWAIVFRFMWGLLNGNIGVAKTYLAEILDDTNQSRGFAVIGVQAGIGRLFGPAIGGLLARPAEKYPWLDIEWFRMYPYLLPCLIAAMIAGLGFLGTLFYLEETLDHVVASHGDIEAYEAEDPASPAIRYSPRIDTTHVGTSTIPKPTRFRLCNKIVLSTTALYGIIAFIGIMSNEVFPLWALNDPVDGGFQFNTIEIGLVYTISAPFEVFYQIKIFPKLAARYGPLGFIQSALLVFAVMIFILPFTALTVSCSPSIQWITLCTTFCFMVLSRLSCFTNVFVLVNNSGPREYRARINGIGQTFAAAARIISPTFCSILFAWSETNALAFPFNFHFVFVITSILSFGAYTLALSLPASLNKKLT